MFPWCLLRQVMSLSGIGVPESPERAIAWFEQAAELGFKEAQYRFALFLETGQISTETQVQETDVKEKEKAVRRRNSLMILQESIPDFEPGAEKIRKNRALGWYLRAARQKHAMAQHRAGILYGQGCVPQVPIPFFLYTCFDMSSDSSSVTCAQDDQAVREQNLWPSRPSVVTWGKSYEASIRAREAKPFRTMPSVVSWFTGSSKAGRYSPHGPYGFSY